MEKKQCLISEEGRMKENWWDWVERGLRRSLNGIPGWGKEVEGNVFCV